MTSVVSITDQVNHRFIKERFGTRTTVILKEVRRNKVVLQYPDREDRFTLTLAEFQKFYRPL